MFKTDDGLREVQISLSIRRHIYTAVFTTHIYSVRVSSIINKLNTIIVQISCFRSKFKSFEVKIDVYSILQIFASTLIVSRLFVHLCRVAFGFLPDKSFVHTKYVFNTRFLFMIRGLLSRVKYERLSPR